MRILVVEDDPRLSDALVDALRSAGHGVEAAASCHEARERFRQGAYSLAIIDVMLPDGTGIELTRELRRAGDHVPILLVTALSAVHDRVAGLDAGADDYLPKPFDLAELLARVRALGRRGARWIVARRKFGDLILDRDARLCTRAGENVPLTPREFDLLALLAWRDGRVVPRTEVLESVWGDVHENAARSLDVIVARLRRKLDSPGMPSCIRTIRQHGYSWTLTREES
jgi:two-component system OmpR family response regulator